MIEKSPAVYPRKVHPRKLARSMAKARIGSNKIRNNWRRAAADQAKNPFGKGELKK